MTAARTHLDREALGAAIEAVRAGARARDQEHGGAFPEDAIAALEQAGALAGVAAGDRASYDEELRLLRRVAAADAGVARILDGHLNAVERLRVQAPEDLARRELRAVTDRRLRAGVWGADPGPDEGPPARLDGATVSGVKVFCSGAGGLDRALVPLTDPSRSGPPLAVWVDLTEPGTVEIDRTWFKGSGMRSSASHRVVFDRAPVLAVIGGPGGLTVQPWFARDAVRTAATWVGAADAAAADALEHLAARPTTSDLEALAAARIRTGLRTMGLWLAAAGRELDEEPQPEAAGATALDLRVAIADAVRALLDEAERATGSRPPATGAVLDRAARDLRLFLLQHRLEPLLVRDGHRVVTARR